ncbi:MAG: hypothetical protein U1F76_02290 [Candidatus Competibacteraceae bacterium]
MTVVEERVDRLEDVLKDFVTTVGIEFSKLYNSQMRTEAELRAFKDEMKDFKDEMHAFKDEMSAVVFQKCCCDRSEAFRSILFSIPLTRIYANCHSRVSGNPDACPPWLLDSGVPAGMTVVSCLAKGYFRKSCQQHFRNTTDLCFRCNIEFKN